MRGDGSHGPCHGTPRRAHAGSGHGSGRGVAPHGFQRWSDDEGQRHRGCSRSTAASSRHRGGRRRIMVVKLVAALVLPFLPVSTVDVDFATAMVLLGFAVGWASAGGAVGAVDRPAAALGAGAGGVHGAVRGGRAAGPRHRGERCARLGVAARAARAGGLDGPSSAGGSCTAGPGSWLLYPVLAVLVLVSRSEVSTRRSARRATPRPPPWAVGSSTWGLTGLTWRARAPAV